MTARLVGWMPDRKRLDRPLGAVARLGAMADNDVIVRVDGVSRNHARIVQQPDGYWLEDAGSRNGTWLNGERITRSKLRHLDVITLGRFAEIIFLERGGDAPAPVAVADGLQVRLEWLDGPERGTVLEVPHGEVIIGRAESCGVVVESDAISRAHARLTITAGGVTLEDLGSVNGTSLNGRPLTRPASIETGAEVDLGRARRFRVSITGTPSAAVGRLEGTTPIGSQDMEWATRLVWSAADLSGGQQAGVAGIPLAKDATPPPAAPVRHAGVTKQNIPATSATKITPASPPPSPSTPEIAPPTQLGGRPGLATTPAALIPATDQRTALGQQGPGDVPTALEGVESKGTIIAPAQQLGVPQLQHPPESATPGDATQLEGDLRGRPAGRMPTVLKGPADRSEKPPLTVLGFRDVGPTPRPGTTRPPREGPSGPWQIVRDGESTAPIESIKLTGSLGVFVIPVGTATVGRAADATIRIDSREMSRVHAILTIKPDGVTVEDRGSVNGTSINGKAITGTHAIVHGDRVSFADFEFRLEVKRTEGNT